MGLLDGTDRAPAETMETEDENKNKISMENPAYATWIARDQQVLRFLLNSLSPGILSHVIGVDSTAEAWSIIDNMFKTAARSKVQHLHSTLNDTKKLQMSADDYYTKMKDFGSELAAVGKLLDEDELIGYMLRGLDKVHYNSLITNVTGKPETTLDEFYSQLSAYDMRNSPQESDEGFNSSANLAHCGDDRYRGYSPERRRQERRQDYHGGGGGGSRDRRDRHDERPWHRDDDRPWHHDDDRCPRQDGGGGGYRRHDDDERHRDDGGNKGCRRPDHAPTPLVDTTCQICNIHGHPAKDCWWRYGDDDDSDRGRKGDKGANFASYGVDTNWYSDTGATDHITSELNKLSMHEKYTGHDRVCTIEVTSMHISLVIQNLHILMVPLILIISFMFLVHRKIFFPFIDSLLIIMSLLSFTLSSF
jgi:hypothetical protein